MCESGWRLVVRSGGGLSCAVWHLDGPLSRCRGSVVTEDNLALDVRGSPGKTAVRMALACRLLMRICSTGAAKESTPSCALGRLRPDAPRPGPEPSGKRSVLAASLLAVWRGRVGDEQRPQRGRGRWRRRHLWSGDLRPWCTSGSRPTGSGSTCWRSSRACSGRRSWSMRSSRLSAAADE
jgi:hypothetical protein